MTSYTFSSTASVSGAVLLTTAHVQVATRNSSWIKVRALLDQVSTATLMSKNLAQLLHMQRHNSPMQVVGLNGVKSTTRCTAAIRVSPQHNPTPEYTVNAIILSSLTNYKPD